MKKVKCIICPLGCEIDVKPSGKGKDMFIFKGAQCKVGENYALKETTTQKSAVAPGVIADSETAAASSIMDKSLDLQHESFVNTDNELVSKICGTDPDQYTVAVALFASAGIRYNAKDYENSLADSLRVIDILKDKTQTAAESAEK